MARQLRPVGIEFVETAPVRLVFAREISASPAAVFRALAEDVPGWADWFGAVTLARSVQEGARREVRLKGGTRFLETVLVAKEAEVYAYRVDETNAPGPRALVEEWRLTPAGTGTRVQWTFAADGPHGVSAGPDVRALGPRTGLPGRRHLARPATGGALGLSSHSRRPPWILTGRSLQRGRAGDRSAARLTLGRPGLGVEDIDAAHARALAHAAPWRSKHRSTGRGSHGRPPCRIPAVSTSTCTRGESKPGAGVCVDGVAGQAGR